MKSFRIVKTPSRLTVFLAITVAGIAFGVLGHYFARVNVIPGTPSTQEMAAPLPLGSVDRLTVSFPPTPSTSPTSTEVFDLEGVKKLKVGDVVSGMNVSSIVPVPGVTSARPEIAPVTRITFAGQREVRGSYTHFGDVSDDPTAVYDPSYTVVFIPVPPSQLPLGVIASVSGGLCFAHEENAKRAFPVGSSGTATILIDNYSVYFPVSEGCGQADFIRVVEK